MPCPCEQSCTNPNPQNLREVLKACEPTLFHTVKRPASLGDDTVTPPEDLNYKNVLLVYLANGHVYLYSSDGVPTFISYLPTNVEALEQALAELQEDLAKETLERHDADEALSADIEALQKLIEAIKNSPDVVDIVQSYADLEAYDTSTLGDKDIIRVLDDDTHDNASTYYRWDKTEGKWNYIGQTNPGIISSDKPGDITVNEDHTASMNGYEGMQHDIQNLIELTQGRDTPVLPAYVHGSATQTREQYVASGTASGGYLPTGYQYMPVSLPRYDINTGKLANFPDEVLYPIMDLSKIPYGGPEAGLMLFADKQRLDRLLDITAIGDGLTLEDGVLSASGGGSSVTLLDAYTASPATDSAYSAKYVNSRLENTRVLLGYLATAPSSASYSIAIGPQARVVESATGGVAIGSLSTVGSTVAPSASPKNAVAIGANSRAFADNEFSIGNQRTEWTVLTRRLTNVTAGTLPTDAVNLQQMQDYVAEHGGGGSTTLYEEYGENTDGALTQAFVSGVLNTSKVAIGAGASAGNICIAIGENASSTSGTAVGRNSVASANGALALAQDTVASGKQSAAVGYVAKATHTNSVALGFDARTQRINEVSIGWGQGGIYGPKSRYLTGVTAGELGTDAVNVAQLKAATSRAQNLPLNVFYEVSATDYNQDDITLHFVNKDLATGGDSAITLDLAAAKAPSADGNTPASAGIMSATQATQLAALAEAYEAEEKGIELYSGTASVNTVTLSQTANNFDHLRIVGEYMGMGSSAIKQAVAVDFYPDTETRSFQMTATDITVGDMPMVTVLQDIWMLSEDGLDLDVVSSTKADISTGKVETSPEGTSQFTLKRVVGFGKLS